VSEGDPTAAYAALAPFAGDEVAKGNPPEASGEKGSGAAPEAAPALGPRRPGLRPTPARATRVARTGAVRAASAGGGIRCVGVSSSNIVGCPEMPGVAGVLVNLPRAAVLADTQDNGAQGPVPLKAAAFIRCRWGSAP
jgi:hypothetical protein